MKLATAIILAMLTPAALGITLRENCSWRAPGSDPYKGTVGEAMSAMGLSSSRHDDVRTKMLLGLRDDAAVITRYGIFIRGTGEVHQPVLRSMAFGNSMCFGTFVNFGEHVYEEADIYRVAGRTFIVPHVCGNIGELFRATPVPDQPASWRSNEQIKRWIDKRGGELRKVNNVPEPGTLPLMLAAAGMGLYWRKRAG